MNNIHNNNKNKNKKIQYQLQNIKLIILFIVNLKKIRFQSGMNTIPKGKRFSTTVLNVGMALYMIVWIVIIIVQLFQ